MSGVIDKVIVWQNQDGSIQVTKLAKSGQKKEESEQDYLDRVILKYQNAHEDYKNAKYFIKDRQSVNDLFKNSHFDKLRVDNNGSITVDNNAVPKEEKTKQEKEGAKTKLKALGLTQEEVDAICR